MRSLENEILEQLIDKYEKSQHFFKQESKRRVILNAKDFKLYKSANYSEKVMVHEAVEALQKQGFISYQWYPHEEGNLLDKVFLSPESIGEAYRILMRSPLALQLHCALEELQLLDSSLPWVQSYKAEMQACLIQEKRFHRLLPDDAQKRGYLLKTLGALSMISELTERLFSTQYLGNSKNFEQHVRSRLLTILKTYGEAELDDDQLLASVGIVRNYDELLLKGNLTIQVDGSWLDLEPFHYGTSLNPETIRRIQDIRLIGSSVLTIENKAVYYERIKQAKEDEIVIYLGGFFGKYTRHFIEKLYAAAPEAVFYHWGDIDLGGFMIYDTLKHILGERLHPLHMDLDTLTGAADNAMIFNEAYGERLAKYLDRHPDSEFTDVGRYMLEKRVRFEQEALII